MSLHKNKAYTRRNRHNSQRKLVNNNEIWAREIDTICDRLS